MPSASTTPRRSPMDFFATPRASAGSGNVSPPPIPANAPDDAPASPETTDATTTTLDDNATAETTPAEPRTSPANPPVGTPTRDQATDDPAIDSTTPVVETVAEEAPDATPTGQPTPPTATSVMEEGADLPGFVPTTADRLLDSVFGDHPHQNDGCHLDGGIVDDATWQKRWKRTAQLTPKHYSVPSGRVGRRFVGSLATEFQGVEDRLWNSEKALVFVSVVLQTTPHVRKAKDIRRRLEQRMDLWDKGHFEALVDDMEAEVQGRKGGGRGTQPPDEDSLAQAFNATILSGRLRKAVRNATSRGNGGVLQPDDDCTKTGRPVLEVLRGKHPKMRDPDPDMADDDRGSFEPYEATPQPLPLCITEEVVEKVASRLSGSAGPGGADSVDLRNWLLRFGAESERLRSVLASLAEWLANTSPPWAAYRALMAARLVALDKCPGVRPVGIGEIVRRLLAKCVLNVVGSQATAAAGNLNLCAGLPAGIEGAVHAMGAPWEGGTEVEPGDTPDDMEDGPLTQPAPSTDEQGIPTSSEDPECVLLVDAGNGFNELGRKAMLWTVRHMWASGARFAFNCYRHAGQLILRRNGEPCYTLLSEEGVTQGDPLSMVLYGLSLVPLARRLRDAVPTTRQAWYADDSAIAGRASGIGKTMELLRLHGPARGYYPEPSKSILICTPDVRDAAQVCLGQFDFQYCDGHRYVGGFVGTEESKRAWLTPKIQQWVDGIKTLSRFARHFPQTAYAGLTKSLQPEWQYLQRVLPGGADVFKPVEEALATAFLPALFQEPDHGVDRGLLALTTRCAGLGIPDPTRTATECHATSVACTQVLTESLISGTDLDAQVHAMHAGKERQARRKVHKDAAEAQLKELTADLDPPAARRYARAKQTGSWLTTTPDLLNGTVLSSEEFRDSLRLRYGLTPLSLPERCDGCSQKFSVGHAMTCKKGGLVQLRHNDVAAEWHQLCAKALSPSAVSDEPLIHSCRDSSEDTRAAAGTERLPELRGDVAVHGFWRRGSTTIFDVRITDTDSPSYRGQAPEKVLARQEKEKKDKYNEACLARRRHFTPLVFSVDGLQGAEAKAASRRLASRLSAKWKRQYSEVCGFVRSRLSMALVRTTSLCLRGARDPTARATPVTWESGSGLSLYH